MRCTLYQYRGYIVKTEFDGLYFVGSVSNLPGCHSQARTITQLKANMEEAINLYLEVTQQKEGKYE